MDELLVIETRLSRGLAGIHDVRTLYAVDAKSGDRSSAMASDISTTSALGHDQPFELSRSPRPSRVRRRIRAFPAPMCWLRPKTFTPAVAPKGVFRRRSHTTGFGAPPSPSRLSHAHISKVSNDVLAGLVPAIHAGPQRRHRNMPNIFGPRGLARGWFLAKPPNRKWGGVS